MESKADSVQKNSLMTPGVIGTSVKIFAPATIANVVCGFDVLGMALNDPCDIMQLTLTNEPGIRITHNDTYKLPTVPEQNVAGVSLLELIQELEHPYGFDLIIEKQIKPGSGLGSSAASAAGAVFAANNLLGNIFSKEDLVRFAMAGEKLEMEDISNQSFMPEDCMKGDVENFYAEMEKHEDHFLKLVSEAKKEGKKLKFVARYEDGAAAVKLQHIDPQHDFFHLYGKDNAVLFYTDRYTEQPLVIKGAGAGAEVTASGVFADIIRAAV